MRTRSSEETKRARSALKRMPKHRYFKGGKCGHWLLAMAGASVTSAFGQSIIAPPPPAYSGSVVADPLAEREPGETDADILETTLYGGAGALQWGIAHLHPRFLYRLVYGTGLQSGPGQEESSFIHEVTPGMFLKLGKHWMLDYAPTLRFYTVKDMENTVNHNVILSGGASYRDWSFSLAQMYSSTSDPMVQTASQTDEQRYVTDLGAVWTLNDQLALQLGLNQSLRYLDQSAAITGLLTDSKTWSTTDWLRYMWAPGLSTGIGVGLGYDDVSVGSDMMFEQALAQVSWRVQRRLTLSISGGGEFRQYLDSEASPSVNPILNANASYALFEHTQLNLGASHTTSPSYFESQTTETTQISAGIRQRVLGILEFTLDGGYRSYSYASTEASGAVLREDDGFFFTARVSRPIFKKGTVALMYSHSENSSSTGGYDYSSEQVALELGYKF